MLIFFLLLFDYLFSSNECYLIYKIELILVCRHFYFHTNVSFMYIIKMLKLDILFTLLLVLTVLNASRLFLCGFVAAILASFCI